MVRREDMFIRNFGGTLMWKKTPLVKFNIQNGLLVECKPCSKSTKHYPGQLVMGGLNYESFNLFFRDRVVLDGSQDIREYLDALGIDTYDFESIVRYHSGVNYIDCYWVKTPQLKIMPDYMG